MPESPGTHIDSIVSGIRKKTAAAPEIGLVLGSGLGNFAEQLNIFTRIPYCSLPEMSVSTARGHTGALIFGTYKGKQIVALALSCALQLNWYNAMVNRIFC